MSRKSKPPIAIYSALADATRCRIVEILRSGSVPVHELADAFSISRPAISRHLRVMKEAGLVVEVKKGRENLYALKLEKLGKATAWIDTMATAPAKPKAKALEPVKPAPTPIPELFPKAKRPDTPTGINQMGFDF
ncbi:ArsR/SmtB family transcription factor [Devosia rhizoryzae]|uniref:Winged helix-turn-helix transcriptional regulator n=1 Tax=Devosia rhizoryzae TaxID=2774137 RepID=A0ABX7C9H2_9HYPH|nr:metalloregulator ArsR/SmtB family transcription factor [Devosia rhizoryzae]QQR40861.1 winged helix-turn-helix transcriptional regulator [Devosia rhizoryzae]